MRPWIGITTYTVDARWESNAAQVSLLPTAYVESVNRAGGRAVLIPMDDPGTEGLDRLDALVLAGGSDVDPARYGEAPHPSTGWHAERDTAEFLLLRAALARDLPVLGVCRGMQVMAVAYGGRLHQHLPEALGHEGHRTSADLANLAEHAVRLAPGTALHKIFGDALVANSKHHQGVADPGRLTPVGWSVDDDLIEAVEDPDRAFAVGVQWHPEAMGDLRVFAALVAAARADR